MQKTILYIAVLAILGAGVWFFLFSNRKVGEAGFTVSDTAAIGKVFLAPNDNLNTITLERRGVGWFVNGKYAALPSAVNQLLTTIHNQRALYPVPDHQREAVMRSLIGGGIKTEIYDREGRLMRAFFVGNEMGRFSGTAMLKAGAERPYVVQIPGFEGYLTTRYSAELAVWRDKIVFDYLPDEIEEVEVTYPNKPADNFTIVNRDGKLDVRLDPAIRPADKLNERRVASYLTFFRKMYNENYQSFPGLDTQLSVMPEIATVRVKGSGGRETKVRFLYAPVEEGGYGMDTNNPAEGDFDSDRFYAILNDGRDTATVQTPLFERLFRKGPEFYTPDQAGRVRIPGAPN